MDPELPPPEISSHMPEQIPMPDPLPGEDKGVPPTSYTKELTPAEKNNALIQFMGAQYGALNQLDGQIEGHGSLGKGSSEKVKQQVAQVLESTQVAHAPQPIVPQQQVVVPAAVPVPVNIPEPDTPVDKDQLEFNFNVDEKQELLSMIRNLVSSVKAQRTEIDRLTDKIDSLIKVSKKKSPVSRKKAVDTSSKV